jgi:hypothetical protein
VKRSSVREPRIRGPDLLRKAAKGSFIVIQRWGRSFASAAFAAGLLYCFVHFNWPSLGAHFNVDDPMNIHFYWSRGWLDLLQNVVLPVSSYHRPLGGLYFALLYQWFGLNPVPYHVVMLALFLVNAWLGCRLCTLVTGMPVAGGLTALGLLYHANLSSLYYLPAYIFDILCFTFYYAALMCYIRLRKQALPVTGWRLAGFLALYIGALGAKEMAVTLPLALFLYECVCRPGPIREARTPLGAAFALTVAYGIGKAFGRDTLLALEGYWLDVTWPHYVQETANFVSAILYQDAGRPWLAAAVAVVLLLAAAALRRRDFVWLWTLLWITPIPITFLEGRAAGQLYLPLFAWTAVLAGWIALALRTLTCPLPRWAATGVTTVIVAGLGYAWFAKTEHENRVLGPAMLHAGDQTWSIIQQVCALRDIRPGSRIYVVRDDFLGWDSKFIFELCLRDRTAMVIPGSRQPLSPEQVAQMDYVFTFEGGSLKRLR